MPEKIRKKLVLGLLSNLSLEQAQPFFLSLEKSGYDGDICMIVGGLDAATMAFLRARKVQLFPFEGVSLKSFQARSAGWRGFFMSRRERLSLESRLAANDMHPHCSRHFFYRAFLHEHGRHYSHVLLTDVRDVLFQADPFAFEVPDGLSVFLAYHSKTIGTCDHNTRSVLRGFGPEILGKLSDKRIACAGTTLGTTEAIRDHVERVCTILNEKKERETIDQSVHNYLIHIQPPNRLHFFDNFSGPVLTMAYVPPDRLQFDAGGRIIKDDARPINLLHQYDRHRELAPKLVRLLT